MGKKEEQFDNHIYVIFSIIVGLAITEFLEGVALIILNWGRVELYWIHLFWAILVFVYSLIFWWGLWKYQKITWNFATLLLFLGICSTVYLLNKMIFPDIQAGTSTVSLKTYYYAIRAPFFSIYTGWTLLTLIRSIAILKRPLKSRQNIAYIVGVIASASLIIFSGENASFLVTILGIIVIVASAGWMFSHPKMEI